MTGEERVPLKERGVPDHVTLEYCNQRSRLRRNEAEESTTFFFDYNQEGSEEETLNWRELRKLKAGKKWGVIRHPYVLNYINQKLIDCYFFYTLHILANLAFFLLLASHIFSRTMFKDWLITFFIFVFGMFLILKGTIKARVSRSVSFWFVVAFCFNILTYLATLAYVWLPTMFSYDDYNQEVKKIITWFLPIIAIISAWANLLYILRKSPFGIYIFMMTRILRSFGHIATIWIPTLVAFSFAFLLIMRDTGVKPWPLIDQEASNLTLVQTMLIILQAMTKTSTMMIGEVDANDILDTNQWIPSILVLVFEIITVILLMNLMVSLAVGDVTYLKHTAQDKLLKIKVNFVIEALQLSEQFGNDAFRLHTKKTATVLVVNDDGQYFTVFGDFPRGDPVNISDEAYRVSFVESGMRLRIQTIQGRTKTATLKNCIIDCKESSDSRIPAISSNPDSEDIKNPQDANAADYQRHPFSVIAESSFIPIPSRSMASEYFASLHYIWLNIVIFIFSLFLFAVCLYACLFVRWVYKRRLRQKADAMIQCYKNGEDKKREMELKIKRKELHPVPEKKKPTGKQRKVHIVSKPCNEVIQKNANEYIVRQVNEGDNDEVACSPIAMPAQKSFTGPPAQQMQPQYVMVPVELLRTQIKNNRHICSPIVPVVYQEQNQKVIGESVATQTSDVAVNVVEKKPSDDWLAGYDERDAEREEDLIDVDDEPDENGSDKVMKKRRKRSRYSVENKKKNEEKPVVPSEETRVSMENDGPPHAAPATSSDSTTPSTTTTTTTTTSARTSTDPAVEEKKPEADDKNKKGSQEKAKGPEDDPAAVKSNYFTMPGENNASNNDQQPAPAPAQKQATSAPRTSIFPYFVDSKAPEAETTTDKRVAKLTEPRLDHSDSSCALYRGKVKSRTPKSEKVYSGAPKQAKK